MIDEAVDQAVHFVIRVCSIDTSIEFLELTRAARIAWKVNYVKIVK